MRYIKTDIPVKTYVRKYIQAKYPWPITVSTNSTIGCYLYLVLEKQNSPWHKRKRSLILRVNENSKLTDKLQILIPATDHHIYSTGFEVPESKAILINSFFEDMIVQEIHYRCKIYGKVGFSFNQAIDDFCDDYNIYIDEDITHAALRKAEFRYRQRKKISPASVPASN